MYGRVGAFFNYLAALSGWQKLFVLRSKTTSTLSYFDEKISRNDYDTRNEYVTIENDSAKITTLPPNELEEARLTIGRGSELLELLRSKESGLRHIPESGSLVIKMFKEGSNWREGLGDDVPDLLKRGNLSFQRITEISFRLIPAPLGWQYPWKVCKKFLQNPVYANPEPEKAGSAKEEPVDEAPIKLDHQNSFPINFVPSSMVVQMIVGSRGGESLEMCYSETNHPDKVGMGFGEMFRVLKARYGDNVLVEVWATLSENGCKFQLRKSRFLHKAVTDIPINAAAYQVIKLDAECRGIVVTRVEATMPL